MNNNAPQPPPIPDVDPAELFNVLTGAASNDYAQIQACTTRLDALRQMGRFFVALMEIAVQTTVPQNVRLLALLQVKIHAVGAWRSKRYLPDAQRERIRAYSLQLLGEPDDKIAATIVLIVSKIARQDCPAGAWSNLIPDIMATAEQRLQQRYSSNTSNATCTITLTRCFQYLNGVLKELTAIKMLQGVRIMTGLYDLLHEVLNTYYTQISSLIIARPVNTLTEPRNLEDMLLSLLVYKSLSKIAVWKWSRMEKEQRENLPDDGWIAQIFPESALHLKTLVELRGQFIVAGLGTTPEGKQAVGLLSKHIRNLGKFFRKLSRASHARFVELPMCSELVQFYWTQVVNAMEGSSELLADDPHALYPHRFLVQGMSLFKDNLSQWGPARKDGTPNEKALPPDFVTKAVTLIVTKFLPLNPTDLEGWTNDPEEWLTAEEKELDQWEYEIRHCSERVLMTLTKEFSAQIIPLLVEMLREVNSKACDDITSVLRKEAVYCAVGRCSGRLRDSFSFEEWLSSTLVREAQEINPMYPIIKRRIAWLIGKWVQDCSTPPTNPLIWQTLVHLLSNRSAGSDLVVRSTAAVAIKQCADVLDLGSDVINPYIPTIMSELVALLGEVDGQETKNRIVTVMSQIIEQIGVQIIPYASMITSALPQLWMSAGENWMLKSTMLHTVVHLIDAMKEQSSTLSGIVVPLLTDSLSTGSAQYLDEAAFTLWLTALRYTNTIRSNDGSPSLLSLFPKAMETLAANHDLLGVIVDIVEAYIILDGTEIAKMGANDLFLAYMTPLKNAPARNQKDIVGSLNILVQLVPSTIWGEPMYTSGLFPYLLQTFIGQEKSSSGLVVSEILHLMGRILVQDKTMFQQLITAAGNGSDAELYQKFLDRWWEKFDSLSEPRHRKLSAMGMAALVANGRPDVLDRLHSEIFNLWLDVFGELKEAQHNPGSDGEPAISRYWDVDEPPHDYFKKSEGSAEYDRRKQMFSADPIRSVHLVQYVGQCIREAEALHGQQAFEQKFLSKTDPTVRKQVEDALRSG